MTAHLFNRMRDSAIRTVEKFGTGDINRIFEIVGVRRFPLHVLLNYLRSAPFSDDTQTGVFVISDLVSTFQRDHDTYEFHEWPATPIRPPFPTCWFEYRHPVCGPQCMIGCLVQHVQHVNESIYVSCVEMHESCDDSPSGRAFVASLGMHCIPIGADGCASWETCSATLHQEAIDQIARERGSTDVEEMKRDVWEHVWRLSNIPIYALALLNCKNVTTQTHVPPPKLQRATERRKKPPLFTYKTLRVSGAAPGAKSPSGGTLAGVALHVQRGHFKNFDKKPLFGVHTGTYWWQPHARGAAKQGVVKKIYSVEES